MGLSNSKTNAPPSSSSPSSEAVVRRSRSSRITVLKSSCLQSHHSENDDPRVSDCPGEETVNRVSSSSENRSVSHHFPAKCYRTSKTEQSDDPNCTTADKELNEWGESSFTATVSRESNTSSRALSSRSLPSRFLSRFSFYPGNLSFRLTRSNSLSSTRANLGTSTSYATSNDEELTVTSATLTNRNDRPQGCDIFPACFSNKSLRTRHRHFASNNLPPSSSISDFSDNFQDNQQISSDHDVSRSRNGAGVDFATDLFSPINHIDSDGAGNRRGVRRLAAREFAERNVRFSRTLSVSRLRDRVLRRATVSDLDLYRFQQDEEVRQPGHFTGRQGSDLATQEATSDNNILSRPSSYNDYTSSTSAPYYGSPDPVHETPRPRETRYRDLLEHRSNFIERRRRIRSQVRALQRLGSRFQNLSGHERSCILSGQHRAGHCTCRSASRDVNTTDDATDRASISRIVMLAEALFEVLDEIHQQSVVMSSRPSVSSIGSVPAPNGVVDSLPLKIFSKIKKNPSEEAAQCYICLVEYEEGDNMRVLPCHHQFHRACVDKWLKEIHRVCPLCRGDICRPEPTTEGG